MNHPNFSMLFQSEVNGTPGPVSLADRKSAWCAIHSPSSSFDSMLQLRTFARDEVADRTVCPAGAALSIARITSSPLSCEGEETALLDQLTET